jgi:hypothetical protein
MVQEAEQGRPGLFFVDTGVYIMSIRAALYFLNELVAWEAFW